MAEKKPRKARTNYAKNWERLTFYLEAVISIKTPREGDPPLTPYGEAELRAYKSIQAYMEAK
jgi:hypothetical protein